jgi:glycosyltransferase involved in cell wall biosynthesis
VTDRPVPDLAYSVVIPTLGRPSLAACLAALAAADGPLPRRVVLVDDRPLDDCHPLDVAIPERLHNRIAVVASCGFGPAAARNAGWRAVAEPWVVFLDDDVVPGPGWAAALARDLSEAEPRTAAVQGRIDVPLPVDRRPTDWERGTASLAAASWITADMAYRRSALESVSGFDERFRRAFREDADLALRLLDQGWALSVGQRRTSHPVRPASRWVSVKAQAGNADDVLITRLHGRDWWARAGAARGRRRAHLAITTAGLVALAAAVRGSRTIALAAATAWLAGTAELAAARIVPGPRTATEVTTMVVSSALIPPVASWHWLRGLLRYRQIVPWPDPRLGPDKLPSGSRPRL